MAIKLSSMTDRRTCPRCRTSKLHAGVHVCPVCHLHVRADADSDIPIAEEWFVWVVGKGWLHMSQLGFKIELNRDAVEPWQPKGLDEDTVDLKV